MSAARLWRRARPSPSGCSGSRGLRRPPAGHAPPRRRRRTPIKPCACAGRGRQAARRRPRGVSRATTPARTVSPPRRSGVGGRWRQSGAGRARRALPLSAPCVPPRRRSTRRRCGPTPPPPRLAAGWEEALLADASSMALCPGRPEKLEQLLEQVRSKMASGFADSTNATDAYHLQAWHASAPSSAHPCGALTWRPTRAWILSATGASSSCWRWRR